MAFRLSWKINPRKVGVITLLNFSNVLCYYFAVVMSDDSETVEDTKKGSLAEVTDDSCTLEYIEIVQLDRPSDDYHTSEFIHPVVEVKPEDLQEMKQEPDDNGDSHCYVKQEPADEYETEAVEVGSAFIYSVYSFSYSCNSWLIKKMK